MFPLHEAKPRSGAALLALLLTLPAPIAAQSATAARPTALVEWAPFIESTEMFSSLLLMTAEVDTVRGQSRMIADSQLIGDRFGVLGVDVRLSHTATVSVSIEGDRLVEASRIETAAPAGALVRLVPRVHYRYDVLYDLDEPVDERVTFRISVNGLTVGEETRSVRFRPASEYPLQTTWNGGLQDYGWVLAGAVNENDALVDQLLDAARAAGTVLEFSGYARGPREVAQQAFAVWDVLDRLGPRVELNDTPATDSAARRTVRDFRDVARDRRMSSTEAAVLFASLLRRAGIDPVLVLEPDRVLAGFYKDAAHASVVMLELCQLGHSVGGASLFTQTAARSHGLVSTGGSTLKSFRAAVRTGGERYDRIGPQLRQQQQGYRFVDISLARSLGITPVHGRFHDLLRH